MLLLKSPPIVPLTFIAQFILMNGFYLPRCCGIKLAIHVKPTMGFGLVDALFIVWIAWVRIWG